MSKSVTKKGGCTETMALDRCKVEEVDGAFLAKYKRRAVCYMFVVRCVVDGGGADEGQTDKEKLEQIAVEGDTPAAKTKEEKKNAAAKKKEERKALVARKKEEKKAAAARRKEGSSPEETATAEMVVCVGDEDEYDAWWMFLVKRCGQQPEEDKRDMEMKEKEQGRKGSKQNEGGVGWGAEAVGEENTGVTEGEVSKQEKGKKEKEKTANGKGKKGKEKENDAPFQRLDF
jgi:hypothetical protein